MTPEIDPPFELCAPLEILAPVVFNSPHSGRVYPASFLAASRLDGLALRRSEDAYVDVLFAPFVELGMPLLKAHFPRAYVDVNREAYELDPGMFDGELPPGSNTNSVRVAGGLGTIPRIVAEAAEIYQGPLPAAEAGKRIETLYQPYHQKLSETLQQVQTQFGVALLIDCHSMPSATRSWRSPRPDFVLGDRFGTACAPHIVEIAQGALEAMGYSVVRNRPYAGGHITQTYGQPATQVHGLQIEINRGLYLQEDRISLSAGFGALRSAMTAFAAEMAQTMVRDPGRQADAAE